MAAHVLLTGSFVWSILCTRDALRSLPGRCRHRKEEEMDNAIQ